MESQSRAGTETEVDHEFSFGILRCPFSWNPERTVLVRKDEMNEQRTVRALYDRTSPSLANADGRKDSVIGNVVPVAVRDHVRHRREDASIEIVAVEAVRDCGYSRAVAGVWSGCQLPAPKPIGVAIPKPMRRERANGAAPPLAAMGKPYRPEERPS